MSAARRRRKAIQRSGAWSGFPVGGTVQLARENHRQTHPDCTYGDQPHYVPPSLGDPGFYLCESAVVGQEARRPPMDDAVALQLQAISARARGDFKAEREALDQLILLERGEGQEAHSE